STIRHQAQVGRRFEDGRAQDGVQPLEQGVAATPQQRVHLMAESSELFQIGSVHNRKDELSSLFLSTPDSMTSCSWLKGKIRAQRRTSLWRQQGMRRVKGAGERVWAARPLIVRRG